MAMVAVAKFREANLDGAAQWVALVLVVLWTTWLFSSLMAYWGAARTTGRLLVAFGVFWALFGLGDVAMEPSALGVLMVFTFTAPFFVLAWTAGRWPKVTGAILLALSAFAFGYLFDFGRDFVARPSQILTFVMLLVPLMSCGVALLAERKVDDEA